MSSNEKIILGRLKSDAGTFADGELVYLSKHGWDCNWYWGFGYLGNSRSHFHFDSLLSISDGKGSIKCLASELFSETNISDADWWVIRDLFVQAYALKKAAEVYQYGGQQTSRSNLTDIIKNKDRAKEINADLEVVLDALWKLVKAATAEKNKELA